MCEAVGHPVVRLHRSRYAGLGLGGLAPGEWRELTAGEVAELRRRTAGRTGPAPTKGGPERSGCQGTTKPTRS
jgi:23S rRNA pseudouridine2605 synthase